MCYPTFKMGNVKCHTLYNVSEWRRVLGLSEYENEHSGLVKGDTSRLGEKVLAFHKISALVIRYIYIYIYVYMFLNL
jgi:hypothetical protein